MTTNTPTVRKITAGRYEVQVDGETVATVSNVSPSNRWGGASVSWHVEALHGWEWPYALTASGPARVAATRKALVANIARAYAKAAQA